MKPEIKNKEAYLLRAATTASVVTALTLIFIKYFAWFMTGSVAMLGTLADSMIDIFASLVNFWAVRHALEPADKEHRFGHGKAEAVASIGQVSLMGISCIFLTAESIRRLIDPVPIEETRVGIIVLIVSIVCTVALVSFQQYVVRRTRSVAISADELHYRTDILINGAVLLAIILSTQFNFLAADGLFGLGIALYLGYAAWGIFKTAYDELMDKEMEEDERARIREIALSQEEARSIHDLRTRRSGRDVFIQFHLELDPDMKLIEAHRIADEVEAKVKEAFPEAEVLIHQDPAGLEEVPSLLRT